MFVGALTAAGQTPEDIEAKMLEIKLGDEIIYGEGVNADKETALKMALSDIYESYQDICCSSIPEHLKNRTPDNLKSISETLCYEKEGLHKCLLYVTWEKLFDGSTLNKVVYEQSGEVALQSVATTPAPAAASSGGSEALLDAIEEMCGQGGLSEIKILLSGYKRQGVVSVTGAVMNASEVPGDAYSILFDSLGGMLAILSPSHGGSQVNQMTNQIDSVNNYSNCKFIIWFK